MSAFFTEHFPLMIYTLPEIKKADPNRLVSVIFDKKIRQK